MGKNEITITFLAGWIYAAETPKTELELLPVRGKAVISAYAICPCCGFQRQDVHLGTKFALFTL
jgi:rubredoxin